MTINENIGIWKGCGLTELTFIALIGFFVPLIVVSLFLKLEIAFLVALLSIFLALFLGANFLQKMKRNKPQNYYQKKYASLVKKIINHTQYNTYTKL